jgi:aspartate ammonia-lyase
MCADLRVEHDLLGARTIPAGVYWGIHTARAVENFPISGVTLAHHRPLIESLGTVKQAAARANRELGVLDLERADAIDRACADVMRGDLDDQFVVDVVQGGAGTSTNMNANEVIANRALELLGHPLGEYHKLHPNDHVNRGQSTNDVYPTAVKLALMRALDGLAAALERLSDSFGAKADEFAGIPKIGRTQLQDAVPMTVGQEFGAWRATVHEEQARIADARGLLCEINLGATAIGTGITSAPGYAEAVARHLRAITGLPVVTASDLVEATSDTGSFMNLSGVLKRTAVKVSKICNDLRLLSSGPQAGLGDLRLPARQAGSSIMPGKVNPVIPEMVNPVRDAGRRGGAVAAQRIRAHHLPQPAAVDRLDGEGVRHAAHPLRRGNRSQSRASAGCFGPERRDGDRAHPGARLRAGQRARRDSTHGRRGRA